MMSFYKISPLRGSRFSTINVSPTLSFFLLASFIIMHLKSIIYIKTLQNILQQVVQTNRQGYNKNNHESLFQFVHTFCLNLIHLSKMNKVCQLQVDALYFNMLVIYKYLQELVLGFLYIMRLDHFYTIGVIDNNLLFLLQNIQLY